MTPKQRAKHARRQAQLEAIVAAIPSIDTTSDPETVPITFSAEKLAKMERVIAAMLIASIEMALVAGAPPSGIPSVAGAAAARVMTKLLAILFDLEEEELIMRAEEQGRGQG